MMAATVPIVTPAVVFRISPTRTWVVKVDVTPTTVLESAAVVIVPVPV